MNVHKDFHGGLNHILDYIYERYGKEEMVKFLERVAKEVYRPHIERLRAEGLKALADHWQKIFTIEGADFELENTGVGLALKVNKCPAIEYMNINNLTIFERFCDHTRIINDEICSQAGYKASVEYDQERGCCIQRFWRG